MLRQLTVFSGSENRRGQAVAPTEAVVNRTTTALTGESCDRNQAHPIDPLSGEQRLRSIEQSLTSTAFDGNGHGLLFR